MQRSATEVLEDLSRLAPPSTPDMESIRTFVEQRQQLVAELVAARTNSSASIEPSGGDAHRQLERFAEHGRRAIQIIETRQLEIGEERKRSRAALHRVRQHVSGQRTTGRHVNNTA